MEGLLYLAFIAWVIAAGAPYVRAATAGGRIAAWCAVALAMLAGPAGLIILLVVLDEAGLAGMPFVIGTIVLGGFVFFMSAVVRDDLVALAFRTAGWSMLIAPMLLSWTLFVLIPIPLILAFFVHPRWGEFRSRPQTRSLLGR